MDIKITCPHCQQHIEASGEARGMDATCPTCEQLFHIPALEAQLDQPVIKPNPSAFRTVTLVLLWLFALMGAGVVALVLIVLIIGWSVGSGSKPQQHADTSQSNAQQSMSPEQIEDALVQVLQPGLEQSKQNVFAAIHPVGTAKSATVHQVTITEWKNGEPSNNPADIVKIAVRFTLYWEGPITKDGYTKAVATFDLESKRFCDLKVLETNGITNSDIGNTLESVGMTLGSRIIEDKIDQEFGGINNGNNDQGNGYYNQ